MPSNPKPHAHSSQTSLRAQFKPETPPNFKKYKAEVLRILSQRILFRKTSPYFRINTLVERSRNIKENTKVERKISFQLPILKIGSNLVQ